MGSEHDGQGSQTVQSILKDRPADGGGPLVTLIEAVGASNLPRALLNETRHRAKYLKFHEQQLRSRFEDIPYEDYEDDGYGEDEDDMEYLNRTYTEQHEEEIIRLWLRFYPQQNVYDKEHRLDFVEDWQLEQILEYELPDDLCAVDDCPNEPVNETYCDEHQGEIMYVQRVRQERAEQRRVLLRRRQSSLTGFARLEGLMSGDSDSSDDGPEWNANLADDDTPDGNQNLESILNEIDKASRPSSRSPSTQQRKSSKQPSVVDVLGDEEKALFKDARKSEFHPRKKRSLSLSQPELSELFRTSESPQRGVLAGRGRRESLQGLHKGIALPPAANSTPLILRSPRGRRSSDNGVITKRAAPITAWTCEHCNLDNPAQLVSCRTQGCGGQRVGAQLAKRRQLVATPAKQRRKSSAGHHVEYCYKMLFDWDAEEDSQLTAHVGEQVRLVSKHTISPGWWLFDGVEGQGMLPCNYVQLTFVGAVPDSNEAIPMPSGALCTRSGTIEYPDGTVQQTDGSFRFPDKTERTAEAKVLLPQTTAKLLPDGTVLLANGTFVMPSEQRYQEPGQQPAGKVQPTIDNAVSQVWACFLCLYVNGEESTTCGLCGTKMPDPVISPLSTRRPSQSLPASVAAARVRAQEQQVSPWDCAICAFPNVETARCRVCRAGEDASNIGVLARVHGACLLKPGGSFEGVFVVTTSQIIFHGALPPDQQMPDYKYKDRRRYSRAVGFSQSKHQLTQEVQHCVSMSTVRMLLPRRHRLRDTGIELFLQDSTSLLIAFPNHCYRSSMASLSSSSLPLRASPSSSDACRAALKVIPGDWKDAQVEWGQAVPDDDHDSTWPAPVLRENMFFAICALLNISEAMYRVSWLSTSGLTERWQRRQMSNLEYILQLNSLAGRSFNDLTQYPVFPWVVADYTSKRLNLRDPHSFRDLSKPVGRLNDERWQRFKARYDAFQDEVIPSFHYGSHYSSQANTLYFLLRLEPFASMHRHLQGGKFDHADRLFDDIARQWQCCSGSESSSDVRELIPEFFIGSGAFLVNWERLKLGRKQNGQRVNHVRLPPWARSPAEFVAINRSALESDLCSGQLHLWFDLLFGQKQTGKAAEDAGNTFFYLTYAGNVHMDSIVDPVARQTAEQQSAFYGQTPAQLLDRPHPRRMTLEELHQEREGKVFNLSTLGIPKAQLDHAERNSQVNHNKGTTQHANGTSAASLSPKKQWWRK